jgi:hypothetical protein
MGLTTVSRKVAGFVLLVVTVAISNFSVLQRSKRSSLHVLQKNSIDSALNDSEKVNYTAIGDPSVLFLLFCGGPSGRADMDAILDTWGSKVTRAVIMSNTPEDLPLDRIDAKNNHNATWRVEYASSLDKGKHRDPRESWSETVRIIHVELERDPSIQWIVRSDSDTWWNVDFLHTRLLNDHILTPDEPLMMGQFFGLKDFKWVAGVSKRIDNLDRDDGRNAYLSGGAGIVFTRVAIERLHTCLPKNELQSSDISVEDVWLSNLAYNCNVTLQRNAKMHQFPRKVTKQRVPKTISVHRVAGDGRRDYRHPSYYENALR